MDCCDKELPVKVLLRALVVCTCLGALSATFSFAQVDSPIGRHYANKITLNSHSQLEFDNLWNPPTVLDFNADGKDDVVFSELSPDIDGPSAFFIWVANEDGVLENVTLELIEGSIPTTERGTRQIIPVDFNGDGKLDLFLESHGPELDCGDTPFSCWPGAQNELLLSNSEGKLVNVTPTHLPELSDFTHGSAVLDFDGDDDTDIWVNNLGGNTLFDVKFSLLLENDGVGKFTVAADSAMGNEQTPIIGLNGILPGLPDDGEWGNGSWSLALDTDGDSATDLSLGMAWEWYPEPSICSEPCKRNFLLINNGVGQFDFLPSDSSPLPEMHDIASVQGGIVYDFNVDGLDDQLLLIDLPEAVYYQILISNGDGTFRDETATRYPNEPVWPVSEFQLHDLDGDGHKDIFRHVGQEGGFNDIRVNDGEGYFRPLGDDWVQTLEWFWVVLDVDGDGGTDFLINDVYGYTLAKMNLPYGPMLDGTTEDDRLIGGAHDNVYRGLEGNDVLDGGPGNDVLDGGAGDDELIGGKGEDRMIPGSGTDSIDGGPDRDTVEYDYPISDAEIFYDSVTLISRNNNSSNDQVETTEYALFIDGATPLPTKEQSAIASLNGVAGLWYDPDLDGEGFNVITTPSGTVIFFYGFNANSERLWLISEILANDLAFEQVFDLQMYEAQGGTFAQPAPSSESLSEWGRLKGLFDACGSGRFALLGKDGVKTSYQTKLAGITNADCQVETLSAPSGLAGLWYDPLLEGEGYNLIITENVTVMLFYGYGADGQRLWLLSEAMAGAPVIGETATLQMFVSTDGTFDEPLASSEVLKDWGELEITFSSCGTALANLTGDDGEKTSNLSKLAGIDQSTCP
jgi:Ca2+-binding RTX toxin-like protein